MFYDKSSRLTPDSSDAVASVSFLYLSAPADEYAHSFELCESRGFGMLLAQILGCMHMS